MKTQNPNLKLGFRFVQSQIARPGRKRRTQNPVLRTRKALISRFRSKKKFVRQNYFRQTKLPLSWRRPRGIHNKLRHGVVGKSPCPNPGYRTASIIRNLHPSGYEEILVSNLRDLSAIDSKTQAARFRSSIGKKLRLDLTKKSKELGIKILNPGAVKQ